MFVTPDVLFSVLINQSWDTVACKDRSKRLSIAGTRWAAAKLLHPQFMTPG